MMVNMMTPSSIAASNESMNTSIAVGANDRPALTGICVGIGTSAASRPHQPLVVVA